MNNEIMKNKEEIGKLLLFLENFIKNTSPKGKLFTCLNKNSVHLYENQKLDFSSICILSIIFQDNCNSNGDGPYYVNYIHTRCIYTNYSEMVNNIVNYLKNLKQYKLEITNKFIPYVKEYNEILYPLGYIVAIRSFNSLEIIDLYNSIGTTIGIACVTDNEEILFYKSEKIKETINNEEFWKLHLRNIERNKDK